MLKTEVERRSEWNLQSAVGIIGGMAWPKWSERLKRGTEWSEWLIDLLLTHVIAHYDSNYSQPPEFTSILFEACSRSVHPRSSWSTVKLLNSQAKAAELLGAAGIVGFASTPYSNSDRVLNFLLPIVGHTGDPHSGYEPYIARGNFSK